MSCLYLCIQTVLPQINITEDEDEDPLESHEKDSENPTCEGSNLLGAPSSDAPESDDSSEDEDEDSLESNEKDSVNSP